MTFNNWYLVLIMKRLGELVELLLNFKCSIYFSEYTQVFRLKVKNLPRARFPGKTQLINLSVYWELQLSGKINKTKYSLQMVSLPYCTFVCTCFSFSLLDYFFLFFFLLQSIYAQVNYGVPNKIKETTHLNASSTFVISKLTVIGEIISGPPFIIFTQ